MCSPSPEKSSSENLDQLDSAEEAAVPIQAVNFGEFCHFTAVFHLRSPAWCSVQGRPALVKDQYCVVGPPTLIIAEINEEIKARETVAF
ncbi:hypothetical protein Y1Q_0020920 [Alligator mississippiensis]|uniref:Uncharacterized protein n=1 Tax=Alligator mississippiensis TaxID=8496 RepID=A0A151NJD2_ALLMI|nr:hypothetical protein Y1Q_0020920 [Alligator mississippiensis]